MKYFIFRNGIPLFTFVGSPKELANKMNKVAEDTYDYDRDDYRVKAVENGKVIGIWNGYGDVYKGSTDRAKPNFVIEDTDDALIDEVLSEVEKSERKYADSKLVQHYIRKNLREYRDVYERLSEL